MSTKYCKRTSFPMFLSGILLIIFGAGDTYAWDRSVAVKKCNQYPEKQVTLCQACVTAAESMVSQPMCKDYLHLMGVNTSVETTKKTEKIDPTDIEKNITELKNHCSNLNSSKQTNNKLSVLGKRVS